MWMARRARNSRGAVTNPPPSSDESWPARVRCELQQLWQFLLPEERLLVWVALAVAVLCHSTGTGFTVRRVLAGYDGLFAYNLALIFVVSRVVYWWRQRHPHPMAWNDGPSLLGDISMIRATLFVMAYLTVYTNLKVRIPMLNPDKHDWGLRVFERQLFFGIDPVAEFRTLQEHPTLMRFLDEVYHHGYLFMALCTLLLYMNHGPRHVRHLVTSMGVLYLLGVAFTALWPTLGPCFFEPASYKWLRQLGLESAASQSMLRGQQKAAMEAFALAETREIRAFSGIAALPSLHVGHLLLLVRFASAYFPRLNWVFVPATLLTWVATLAFGWHYLMDGLVVPLFVAAAWFISQRLVFGQQDPPRYDTKPQPTT